MASVLSAIVGVRTDGHNLRSGTLMYSKSVIEATDSGSSGMPFRVTLVLPMGGGIGV